MSLSIFVLVSGGAHVCVCVFVCLCMRLFVCLTYFCLVIKDYSNSELDDDHILINTSKAFSKQAFSILPHFSDSFNFLQNSQTLG